MFGAVVVAVDVVEGAIEDGDDIFEIVVGQVAAADDEVDVGGGQAQVGAVDARFDLVADGQDAVVAAPGMAGSAGAAAADCAGAAAAGGVVACGA